MPSFDPRWRLRLQAVAASLLALWVGASVASESVLLPSLLAGGLLLFCTARFVPVPLPALALGLCCAGMMIGNRGFAQLSPGGGLPLFPAELCLALAGGLLLLRSLLQRRVPWQADLLNAAVAAWMLAGTARLPHDLRAEGAVALRDYATVYYGLFFFIAQVASGEESGRRFLGRVFLVAPLLMLVSFAAFDRFPDFFLGPAAFNGIPLVYFKGDLAGTFMAAGAVLWLVRAEQRRDWRALLPALLLAAVMLSTRNRASLAGFMAALLALAAAGRWRPGAWLALSGTCALVALLVVLEAGGLGWRSSPLLAATDQVRSLADPLGSGSYQSEEAGNKGDNNRFRAVWWRISISDTLDANPAFGQGWGHDLAAPFLRSYFPADVEDFGARSPHNILVTLFARTGMLGLAPFLLVLTAAGAATWRALHGAGPLVAGAWLAAWVVFVSACFGVVLEGPMGAAIFWSLLGFANAKRERSGPSP